MKKYLKNIFLVLLILTCFCVYGCRVDDPVDNNDDINNNINDNNDNNNDNNNDDNDDDNNDDDEDDPWIDEHECVESDWIDVEEFTCGERGDQYTECTICGELMNARTYRKEHEYIEEVVKEVTCTENGQTRRYCIHCGNEQFLTDYSKGHVFGSVAVVKSPSSTENGIKDLRCANCKETMRSIEFVNNGFTFNGKLSVNGRDLVNKFGQKIQLFGLSTHGIQWFGRYANMGTIASLVEGFGINVIRFAFYTDENGYCDGGETKQEEMLTHLYNGIDAATKLGLYVIIDWHMVGAENVADKNPLTYLEESKEFFSFISEKYKRYDNILYEIMNEPNGNTTWAQCKQYANEVIPCIRKNSDGIILVGNPNWTADLNSVMKSPLTGYENIMYTYHFYAADHRHTSQVENAYDSGFPVFISEYGFMNSDGDGAISDTYGQNWKRVLDERNISYVAWNISNSGGSASIFKKGSSDMIDVSDSNLKEWGIYLKKMYREMAGLDK